MIRKKIHLQQNLVLFLDAVLLVAAYIAAFYLRRYLTGIYKLDILPGEKLITPDITLNHIMEYIWPVEIIWLSGFYFQEMYKYLRIKRLTDSLWTLISVNFYGVLILSLYIYIFKFTPLSRIFLLLFVLTNLVLIMTSRVLLRIRIKSLQKQGVARRHILLVGSGPRAARFIENINRHQDWGLSITVVLDYCPDRVGADIAGLKVSGTVNELDRILDEHIIDEVVFIVPRSQLNHMEPHILRCELEGIKTSVNMDLYNLRFARSHPTEFCGIPMLTFETTPSNEWHLLVKRIFDIVISLLALVLLSPLYLVTAAAIKLGSPGPVFFIQQRMSLNGRLFNLIKFRSMITDAPGMRAQMESLNELEGPTFKISRDPRVTPLGRFLRKTSIDELPQFFNVLKGDMSIVGPRPLAVYEMKKIQSWQKRRHSMRPGITCLWQISGRNEILSFDEWTNLDLEYIDTWSLKNDFIILLKTIPAVLRGTGAK